MVKLLFCSLGDMSDIRENDAKEEENANNLRSEEVAGDSTAENSMPSSQEQEETIKKKYGGMIPKKPPLISKDHERAFFDSADWALGKGTPANEKPKGPLEALRPKLQPTHQQVRARRSAYAPADGEDGGNGTNEDPNSTE